MTKRHFSRKNEKWGKISAQKITVGKYRDSFFKSASKSEWIQSLLNAADINFVFKCQHDVLIDVGSIRCREERTATFNFSLVDTGRGIWTEGVDLNRWKIEKGFSTTNDRFENFPKRKSLSRRWQPLITDRFWVELKEKPSLGCSCTVKDLEGQNTL